MQKDGRYLPPTLDRVVSIVGRYACEGETGTIPFHLLLGIATPVNTGARTYLYPPPGRNPIEKYAGIPMVNPGSLILCFVNS